MILLLSVVIWSQAQWDTSDWDNYLSLDINEQYVIDVSICDVELRC